MPTPGRLAPLTLLALIAACSSNSNPTSSGTTTTATGTGGGATTTTAGTGGSMTTTSSSGGGGSEPMPPPGCQEYVLSGDPDVVVNSAVPPSTPGGIAWNGTHYEAVYTGTAPVGFQVYLSVLNPTGTILSPPGTQPLGLLGADASGGPIVSAGAHRGALWSDRRTGDYEIFFSLLKENGAKVDEDLRISSAVGFSINSAIAWTGSEFLAVWQDDRNKDFHVFGQRIDKDGALVGNNLELTKPASGSSDEAPQVAVGPSNVGVAYVSKGPSGSKLTFRIFPLDLGASPIPPLTIEDAMGEPSAPVVVWNFDRYVVAWQDLSSPAKGIRAVAVGANGAMLVPPAQVTNPGTQSSRSPQLLGLGDSLLLAYADDRDQNGGYEIYARTISPALAPLSAELRVTDAMGDSVYPVIAAGAGAGFGDVGILFRDNRVAQKEYIFFTRIKCKAGGP